MNCTNLSILTLASLLALPACSKDEKKETAPSSDKTAEPAQTAEPAKPEAPTKTEEPAAAAAVDATCPAGTTVTTMKFTPAGQEPFALDATKFTVAKARLANAGKLQIYIATQDWALNQLGIPQSPIENDGDAYLNLTIRSEDLGAGKEYAETGDLESKISTTLYTKGLASGVHTAPPSRVKLLGYSADSVCGEFELQGMFEGEKTKMVGTFVAPIGGE